MDLFPHAEASEDAVDDGGVHVPAGDGPQVMEGLPDIRGDEGQLMGGAGVAEGVPGGEVSYLNANDSSCEGMDYLGLRAFTVQFHPEACAGPKDTAFLFDRFISLMEGGD